VKNTRRLYLPDGSSFDLPLPPGSGQFVENPVSMVTSGATSWPSAPILVPVLGGILLGAVVTWLILRQSR
jgi:hypothetical protein